MKPTLIAIAAGLLVLGVTGCVDRQSQEQAKDTAKTLSDTSHAVTVQEASLKMVEETVEITGDVTAGEDATVGAKTAGKVVAVFVKDGDTVTAGQLIAQLDTTALMAQLRQADAQVAQALAGSRSAQSSLTQAMRNASVGPQKSTATLRQAQAQVRAAQASLEKLQNGARPEERRQAEASVAAAKSTLDTATKELERIKTLVSQGALAGNRLEQQQNSVDTARSQYENAQQSLNIIRNGARTEDVAAAREQVRQAQESVRNAQAQKELDPLLKDQVDAARSQVESARAQLQSAQAAVAIARQAIEDAQIRAPFGGKVMGRPIQVGAVAGNGATVARIIGGEGVYFSGQLPSTDVSRVSSGMPVTITLDALPGQTFHGTVAAVSGQAQSVGRLFDVRIQLSDGLDKVKPGMFARGSIVVKRVENAKTLPDSAVLSEGDETFVYVADGAKARRVKVTPGVRQGDVVEVNGLPDGAKVIVSGQESLSNGATIKVQQPQAKREDSPKEG